MLFDLFGALNCFKQMFFHGKVINKLSYPYSHIYIIYMVYQYLEYHLHQITWHMLNHTSVKFWQLY